MAIAEVQHPSGAIFELEVPDGIDVGAYLNTHREKFTQFMSHFDSESASHVSDGDALKFDKDEYREVLQHIENPSGSMAAKNPHSSASGPFQFIKRTAQKYGITDASTPEDHVKAFEQFTADNMSKMRNRLGRDPTEAEAYLAHQQGAGGASALLRNPKANAIDILSMVYGSRKLASKAVLNNRGKADMTAGEFASLWLDKFDRIKKQRRAAQIAKTDGGTNGTS